MNVDRRRVNRTASGGIATHLIALLGAIHGTVGCDPQPPNSTLRQSTIYGRDGRKEFFELEDSQTRARMEASTVAFVRNRWINRKDGTSAEGAPTASEVNDLCPGVAFANQPALAFCSGVLVDWDIVLTAGHCLHLFRLEEFSIMFGYYYTAPGSLALDSTDVMTPLRVVTSNTVTTGGVAGLDYALVQIAGVVHGPHEPAPVYLRPPKLSSDSSLVTIGTPNGVPIKADDSGSFRGESATGEYFVADTDTSHGWSGGGLFFQDGLLGILSRGGEDFEASPGGCKAEAHSDDPQEQFSYAGRAIESLCAAEPTRSICRNNCEQPCAALRPQALTVRGGCCIGGAKGAGTKLLVVMLSLFVMRRLPGKIAVNGRAA